MSLKEQVESAMKTAMKSKDKETLMALRSVKSSILLAETEKGGGGGLSPEKEMEVLMKAVKQRKDSAEIYQREGRAELAEKELNEVAVIEEFLPKQLSDEELTAKIKAIVEKTGASSMKDMGKVMGMASKELAGQADNKRIASLVKQTLAGQ